MRPRRVLHSTAHRAFVAAGAVLHVALRTVELLAYQFDPHRDYSRG